MPRRPRLAASGTIHHVTIRGNDRAVVFRDDLDRVAFLRRLRTTGEWHGLVVHAYCLMDTHVHLVLQPSESDLGRAMQYLLGGYAHRFNRRHDRSGHLFEGPFDSRPIGDESYLLTAVSYVVLNAVRAGMCDHPRDYAWSSFHATVGSVPNPVVEVSTLVVSLLSHDLVTARRLFAEHIAHEAAAVRRRRGSG